MLVRSETFLGWLREHFAVAVTLFGLALYGLLRIDYLLFFSALGLAPEDVGLGYSEGIVQSAIAAFAITVAVLLAALLMLPAALVVLVTLILIEISLIAVLYSAVLAPLLAFYLLYLVLIIRAKEGRTMRGDLRKLIRAWWRLSTYPLRAGTWTLRAPVALSRRDPRRLRLVLVLAASLIVLYVLIVLPLEARWAGNEARKGHEVKFGVFDAQLLPIRATPAKVFWINEKRASELPITQGECLLWLGSSGGTVVFFDFRSDEAVSLPSASVVVDHQESCLP